MIRNPPDDAPNGAVPTASCRREAESFADLRAPTGSRQLREGVGHGQLGDRRGRRPESEGGPGTGLGSGAADADMERTNGSDPASPSARA